MKKPTTLINNDKTGIPNIVEFPLEGLTIQHTIIYEVPLDNIGESAESLQDALDTLRSYGSAIITKSVVMVNYNIQASKQASLAK
jgi:hypothetical protein